MGWKARLVAIALITTAWALPLFMGDAVGGSIPSLEGGNAAPDFVAQDIATSDSVTLDAYSGKVVLLNIWATWCEPCKEEMPAMERLHRELGDQGLEVVAVSVDVTGKEPITRFVQEYEITFDVLHDREQRIASAYQVFALPQSFVIDREGRIALREFGPVEWDSRRYRRRFKDLLSREGQPASSGSRREPANR